MTFKGYASVRQGADGILTMELDQTDREAWKRVLADAVQKKKRVHVTVSLEGKDKSDAQRKLYFKALTVLFRAVNGYSPTEGERMEFHDEIKELYANRRESTLRPGKLVPIGVRESDTQDMGALIEGVFFELGQCSMTSADQGKAREFWREFWAMGGQRFKNEEDFRERGTLCAGCGKGGEIHLAHMESRGANPARKYDPANFLPLCQKCHGEQHQNGVEIFLRNNPHLEKRWRERS